MQLLPTAGLQIKAILVFIKWYNELKFCKSNDPGLSFDFPSMEVTGKSENIGISALYDL